MTTTPSKAFELIEKCKLNKEEKIDLSNLSLKKIPKEIAELEWILELNISRNGITKIENLENLTQLQNLDVSINQITKIENLEKLTQLQNLDISNNQIIQIENLDKLTQLRYLNLSDNQISKIENLEKLTRIYILEISNNQITKNENLEKLTRLGILEISNNQITKIENLEKLIRLISLNISNNKIIKIENLEKLTLLLGLTIANNQITKIENLEKLVKLQYLDISYNLIKRIEGLTFNLLEQIKIINLSQNPISELPSEALTNADAILGYLKSKKEDTQVPNKYLKVNIIGDGRIGKTQLFNFFEDVNFNPNQNETHGTKTTNYQIPLDDYQATIWDFGGQSYHHGFHQIFIRPKDFNLVLWAQKDSKDPNYGYWLGTSRNYSPNSPLFLIQNVWTETDKIETNFDFISHPIIYPDSNKLQIYNVGLESVFSINIKALHKKDKSWENRNSYFLNSFHQAMVQYVQEIETFKEVPQKWLNIKETLDKNPLQEINLDKKIFKENFAKELDDARFETLLFFLEFTGNILYFSDNRDLCDYVFPNPPMLSKWIYEDILNVQFKNSKAGVLNFQELISNIGEEKATILRDIMKSFNLIFEEKEDFNNIVIPQFLPEQNNTFKDYLLELIPYSFCVRFADFIHEGRIFQFISDYGKYANDTTSYWRYGIVFTKKDVKSIVYYESSNRTIYVHIENKKGQIRIAQEIFDFFIFKQKKENQVGIRLSQFARSKNITMIEIFDFLKSKNLFIDYNPSMKISKEVEMMLNDHFKDKEPFNKKFNFILKLDSLLKNDGPLDSIKSLIYGPDLKRKKIDSNKIIDGAQLSTNSSNFFDIKETINNNSSGLNIGICNNSKEKIKLDYLAINLLGMENQTLPKVFISYSRKDLEFKNELRSHLSILERYDLLKAWSCDEITAGKWDKQIQRELEDADIIIYMVSHNFMSSEYIMEQEVKKGIQLIKEDNKKKIMCVLVSECMWSSWSSIEEEFNKIKQDNSIFSESMDLSQFQFLPYHQYKNSEGVAIREEIVALEQWGRNQYEVRNVAFKQIITRIFKESKL